MESTTTRAGETGAHLLLAEDDADLRRLLAARLRARGYRVTTVDDGIELLAGIQFGSWRSGTNGFDAIVADINMPGLNAFEVMEAVRCRGLATPIVLITGGDVRAFAGKGGGAAPAAVFKKPIDLGVLDATLRRLLGPA